MNAGITIYSLLSNDSDVTAITGLKIYPNYAPQGAINPCVTYTVNSGGVNSKDGHTAYDASVRINIFVDKDNYSTGVDLSEKVRVALDKQTNGGVKDIIFEDCNELFDFDSDSHQFSHSYSFWIN